MQQLNVAVMVCVPPGGSVSFHALRLCESLLKSGDRLALVFFMGEGVYQALRHADPPADELPCLKRWQSLAAQGVDLFVCSAAAERRGVVGASLASGFALAGLATWVAASSQADRQVIFKGGL